VIGRLQRRRARGDRGAVLIELVIITPILFTIILGVFDLGLAWRASITISNAVRSASRVDANLGKADSSDLAALQALSAAASTIPSSQIDVIVIYKSTTPDGDVPAACVTTTARLAGGVAASNCNTYSQTDYINAQNGTGGFANGFTGLCSSSGRRDRFWCATNRVNDQAASGGPDYVGVYIKVIHRTATKMFGATIDIDDHAVMRIEPNAGNP